MGDFKYVYFPSTLSTNNWSTFTYDSMQTCHSQYFLKSETEKIFSFPVELHPYPVCADHNRFLLLNILVLCLQVAFQYKTYKIMC